jgi:hypothetical protein
VGPYSLLTVPTSVLKLQPRLLSAVADGGFDVHRLRGVAALLIVLGGVLGATAYLGGGLAPAIAPVVFALLLAGLIGEGVASRSPQARAVSPASPPGSRHVPWTPIEVGLGLGTAALRGFRRFAPKRYARHAPIWQAAEAVVGQAQGFSMGMHAVENEGHPVRSRLWEGIGILAGGAGMTMIWLGAFGVPRSGLGWLPAMWLTGGAVALVLTLLWWLGAERGRLPERRGRLLSGIVWSAVAGALVGSRLGLYGLSVASGAGWLSPALSTAALACGALVPPWAYLAVRELARSGLGTARSSLRVTG